MQSAPAAAWRFAPLSRPYTPSPQTRKLEGIVFDVDGTLCKPQTYMFAEMRSALGISKGTDILEHVYSLPTAEAQHRAMEQIRDIERRAMLEQVAQPGLQRLMAYLDARGVRKGICTRNFDTPVNNLLSKFLAGSVFAPIVTRDFRPPKPDPAGILHIARSWGLLRRSAGETGVPADAQEEEDRRRQRRRRRRSSSAGEEGSAGQDGEEADGGDLLQTEAGEEVADASGLIMVGDSIDDITAGRRAGAKTVLLVNDANRHLADHEHTDLVISRLDELIDVLENGLL
ncbi:6a65cf99-e382-4f8a-872b-21e87229c344 [Thermothielavioides terrestris]|uniref:6a65cf99-e382-4f8a-872b-21e87229c344 n=1 Tax=Thermothielavioides terrestris TaxID=2587410 RepID=A0A3S5CWW0_9PEZI|nr:6a65cf99-e382-4f8a-872b-21e87229c344 [Thermothielavioides terrestris]